MAVRVQVDDILQDAIHWDNVFRVLGIKRCQPALAALGVPDRLAQAPQGLLAAARRYWDTRWRGFLDGVGRGYSDPGFPENYRDAMEVLVQDTFDEIAQAYDDHAAQAVYDWARYQFIDHAEESSLWIWSTLLMVLARTLTGRPHRSAPLPLTSEQNERIGASVLAAFSDDADKRRDALLASIASAPPDAFEERVLALEKCDCHPDGPHTIDLIGDLQLVVNRQRSHALWMELYDWLTPAECAAMLDWGRAQSQCMMGAPWPQLTLPTRHMLGSA